MTDHVPTYDELAADRRREWSRAQATMAQAHSETQEQIRKSPLSTQPDSPWETPDVACPCGSHSFAIRRWVTFAFGDLGEIPQVRRHRAELGCTGCSRVGTWDFGGKRWIG